MRQDINWRNVQAKQPGDFNNPVPGGYQAVICRVEDNEKKEYLAIEWDFQGGEYDGANHDTYSRAGFWPTVLRRSYKDSALGFFRAFLDAVERSNSGYIFNPCDLIGLVGKRLGVVLGEEEYLKSNGNIGTRLYVYQTLPVEDIRNGYFQVPDLKMLKTSAQQGAVYPQQRRNNLHPQQSASAQQNSVWDGPDRSWTVLEDEDEGNLPF